MNDNSHAMFHQLHGEQLSAVTFVQDYLQLHFDGPAINVTGGIIVKTPVADVHTWAPGFRDALCAQIAKKVSQVESEPGEHLTIVFNDASRVVIVPAEAGETFYAHGFRNDERMAG